jgi:GT2 family glycosyltransferase
VAFLDDDTLLSPGWAQAVIRAFDADGCAGLGGRVELRFEAPAPKWLSRRQRAYLAEFDLGAEPCWLDDGVAPVGANCAARRTEIHRVGGFREDLDRRAGSLVSNGDTEFFRRLRARGGRLRYEPAALAWHRVGPERLTREFVRRRAYAQGVSDVLVDGEAPLVRELWRYGRAAPILLRGIATRRGTINAVQWVNYCRGRLDAGRRR